MMSKRAFLYDMCFSILHLAAALVALHVHTTSLCLSYCRRFHPKSVVGEKEGKAPLFRAGGGLRSSETQ